MAVIELPTSALERAKEMQSLRESENKISHDKRMQLFSEALVGKMVDLIGKEGTEARIEKLWSLYEKISKL